MRSCFHIATAVLGLLLASAVAPAAVAQAIVVSVNGDPVTTLDIDQRMKLLRVLHKPATRDNAIESLIEDRLKQRDAEKYGVRFTDGDIPEQITRVATNMKTTPAELSGGLQRAGVQQDQIRSYFGADLVFTALVRALNKGVEASETQVREEIAKERAKGGGMTEYVLRQVIIAAPATASPADLSGRAKTAEQLRSRFDGCDTGISLVREMNDVVIREPLRRTSVELSAPMRQLLDKTPVGHLTPPQRGSTGLEMVAVCSRGASGDDSALRTSISDRLLASHLDAAAAARLKDLRSHAVITKPQG
jgi:peptidyl-prolyl cis-trans isomerase SurA